MTAELHPAFRQALYAEIHDVDLGAFVAHLEQQVRLCAQRRVAWSIGPAELKLLVRHRCRCYDEAVAGQHFQDGAYFPLFAEIHGVTPQHRQLLLDGLAALHDLSERLDDPVRAASATSSRVIRTWSQLARRDTPFDPTPATQLMLWRVFESIVKGEIEMVAVPWADGVRHYPRFAAADRLVARRADARRAEVLSNLKFTLGCASLRRPPLVKLLQRDESLSPEQRDVLAQAVGSRDPATAEPIAALLRHHVELIALASYNRLEVFADLVLDFVTHLRGDVLAVGRAPENAAMIAYLTVLEQRYLPGLFNYARILRKASQGSPFLGDLLHESYLLRTRSLDGDQEPSFARLLQDWTAAQRVLQTRAGYKSTMGFSFAQAYLEEAAPRPLGRGGGGQTQRGMPVKQLGEFETFIELPRQDAQTEVAAGNRFDDPEVDESAATTPYQRVHSSELRVAPLPAAPSVGLPTIGGPPPTGPRVLPVRLGSMENLYAASTEILPVLTDDDVDLSTAVTEVLPTTPDGEVDLQRVATQLFPMLPGHGRGGGS